MKTVLLFIWTALLWALLVLPGCVGPASNRVDALPTRFEERQAREANLQPLRDQAFWRHQLELAESRLANAQLDLELAQSDLDWLLNNQDGATTNLKLLSTELVVEAVRQILRDPDSPEPVMEKLPEIARGLRTNYRALKGLPPL